MQNKLQMTFMIFGSFEEYLTVDNQPTDVVFNGYKKDVKYATPDKSKVGQIIYFKENYNVMINANNITINYGFLKDAVNTDAAFAYFIERLNAFNEFEKGICGNRIAIHYDFFIPDNDQKILNRMSSKLHYNDYFGNLAELSYRVNQIHSSMDEVFNCILNVQQGNVTNNQTKKSVQAIICKIDVNSSQLNNSYRFDFTGLDNYMNNMNHYREELENKFYELIEFDPEMVEFE